MEKQNTGRVSEMTSIHLSLSTFLTITISYSPMVFKLKPKTLFVIVAVNNTLNMRQRMLFHAFLFIRIKYYQLLISSSNRTLVMAPFPDRLMPFRRNGTLQPNVVGHKLHASGRKIVSDWKL